MGILKHFNNNIAIYSANMTNVDDYIVREYGYAWMISTSHLFIIFRNASSITVMHEFHIIFVIDATVKIEKKHLGRTKLLIT